MRDGRVIPHLALAQSTQDLDWSHLELRVYTDRDTPTATGRVRLPADQKPHALSAAPGSSDALFVLQSNPLSPANTPALDAAGF